MIFPKFLSKYGLYLTGGAGCSKGGEVPTIYAKCDHSEPVIIQGQSPLKNGQSLILKITTKAFPRCEKCKFSTNKSKINKNKTAEKKRKKLSCSSNHYHYQKKVQCPF